MTSVTGLSPVSVVKFVEKRHEENDRRRDAAVPHRSVKGVAER